VAEAAPLIEALDCVRTPTGHPELLATSVKEAGAYFREAGVDAYDSSSRSSSNSNSNSNSNSVLEEASVRLAESCDEVVEEVEFLLQRELSALLSTASPVDEASASFEDASSSSHFEDKVESVITAPLEKYLGVETRER